MSDSNFDSKESRFRIWHINIRRWTSHAAELTARIRQMDKKLDLICVNETFLNRAIAHITYKLIARRDRSDGRKCNGIAFFALSKMCK